MVREAFRGVHEPEEEAIDVYTLCGAAIRDCTLIEELVHCTSVATEPWSVPNQGEGPV